jgi:hypothetical protein
VPVVIRVLVLGTAAGLAMSSVASAQLRASVGAGAGIAGSTDATLSEGRTAPVAMAQVTRAAGPIGVGLEVNGWWRGASDVLVATGNLQLQVPSTQFFVTLGAGFGRGDPDGLGTISGTAGHVGVAYDIPVSGSKLALTAFGNGFLVYSPTRSIQMVEGGLAITRR